MKGIYISYELIHDDNVEYILEESRIAGLRIDHGKKEARLEIDGMPANYAISYDSALAIRDRLKGGKL